MIYDVIARQKLAEYVQDIEIINSEQSTLKQKEWHQEFEEVTQKALELLQNYQQAPETSAQAQFEYLDKLLQPLKIYKTSYMSGKKWWEKLLNFFGFMLTPEERNARDAFEQIENAHTAALTNYDNIHFPNWIFRIARFFGLHSFKQLLTNKYDLYPVKHKLSYLSHHLMGTTDLNHHKVLQGKSSSQAYHDFSKDIDEFIEQQESAFDKHNKTLLMSIKSKLNQCSDLANEMDKVRMINLLDQATPEVENHLVSDLTYQVQQSMMNLQLGSSLIIPGGFISPRGGHATVVECIRGSTGFVFKVINTGGGTGALESWKTIGFNFLFNDDRKRPIKVTSELSFDEVVERKFIEKILKPTIIKAEESEKAMNAEFLQLYHDGKLHDDSKYLALQTNGTCSHSSLLEWFKMQVPEAVFALFQYTTIEKAHHRLRELKIDDLEQDTAVLDLKKAADATNKSAKEELDAVNEKLKKDNTALRQELGTLLKQKNKRLENLTDFTAYFEKKCRGTKLSLEQQRKIAAANSLDPLEPGMKWTFFSSKPNATEARMRKAIIAKQIAGHETWLLHTRPNA